MRRFLRKKVLISAAIWGKPYINEFINYNLSSMLSDNNLPASTKIADITFQFITTTEGKRTLLKKKFFSTLKNICNVDFFIIDNLLNSKSNSLDKYFFLNTLQTISLKSASNFDYLIFNYADFVWSDGGIYNIIKKIDKNIDAIFGYCPIVQSETGISDLNGFRQKNNIINISPRQAVAWFIKNMHREEKRRFWDDEFFTVTPTTISWKVHNEGMIITPFHKTILVFKVNLENILYYNGILTTSLDGYFSGVVGKNMKVYHVKNSDEFFAVSLDEENTRDSRIGGPSRSNWLNYNRDASMKELLSSKVSEQQRKFSLMHYELIKQNQNRKLWKYVKESSENILKYHFDIFKFEPENYFDHYSTKGFHEIPDIDISGFKNSEDDDFQISTFKEQIVELIAKFCNLLLKGTDFNLNSRFKNWKISFKDYYYLNSALSKLPVKYWLGHFDFEGKRFNGKIGKSLNVPNASLKYSLSIYGSDTKNTFRLSQKIPGFALLRAFSAGFLRCRFYIFTNSPNIDINISIFSRFGLKHPLENSRPIFKNIKDHHYTVKVEPGKWQLIELETKSFEVFKNKMFFSININGLENIKDNVLITDVCYHSKLDFDRLRANDNPLRQFLSNYIYNFLFYYSDNTKLIKKKFVRSSEEIKLNEILHFLYMQKNLTLLKLFLPKRYKYLSLENKKIILVQIIINLLFKLKINFNDVYPLKYRRKVMKSVYKLITFALKFNKNSFVLNYEKFLYSFYQGNIKDSQNKLSIFLNLYYENDSIKYKPVLIYIKKDQININWLTLFFSILKYKIINNKKDKYYLIIEDLNSFDKQILDCYLEHFEYSNVLKYNDQELSKFKCYFFPFVNFLSCRSSNLYEFCNLIDDEWRRKYDTNIFENNFEIEKSQSKKNNVKIKNNEWYVFFDLTQKNELNTEGNRAIDFNNQAIQDYVPSFSYIEKLRGKVLIYNRNGNEMQLHGKLNLPGNVRIINSETSFLEILDLIKNSRLFISAAYGLHAIANELSENFCLVNMPLSKRFLGYKNSINLPKLFFSISYQKILDLNEIFKTEVLDLYDDYILETKGISLLYNTQDEILHTISEALNPSKYKFEKNNKVALFKSKLEKFSKKNNINVNGRFSKIFMNKYFENLF